MFPTWALERVAYWAIFALIVLSFEKLGRNMNLNKLRMEPRIEKTITAIVILGIVLLFSWAAFHV